MQIIDNFLSDNDFKSIQSLLTGSYFPWYFQDGIASIHEDNKYQFCHTFFDNEKINSCDFDNLYCFFEKLNMKKLKRVKANLRPKTAVPEFGGFHIDFKDKITSIFYVNSNNGKTLFEDGKEVDSIENRMVIFDSNLIHQGISCTDAKNRIVINFNYE